MAHAGLAITLIARCAVPPDFTLLGSVLGLPEIGTLEIVLARSATSNRPPCDEAELEEQFATSALGRSA